MPVSLEHKERVLKLFERQQAERNALALENPDDRPCKNEGLSVVGTDGECLRCGADQGEGCRS